MEIRLVRSSAELTRLDYREVAGQWNWILTDYDGDTMTDASVDLRDGIGGRQVFMGAIPKTRRIVITLSVQGTSHTNLHLAIRELESHLRWRDNTLELQARRDSSQAWASIPVILEQLSISPERETFYARATMRFVATRQYWARDITTTVASNYGELFTAILLDLNNMNQVIVTGLDQPIFEIDFREASSEWILFGASKIWRVGLGSGPATLMENISGASICRGCVADDGSILVAVSGTANRVVRVAYPSGQTTLGTCDAAVNRIRKIIGQDLYTVVGRFSTYGSTTGLAGMVVINSAGAVANTYSPYSSALIGPSAGEIKDVYRVAEGIGVAVASQASPPRSYVTPWSSGGSAYQILESGNSTFWPTCIDQQSPIDALNITAEGNVHINRYFGCVSVLRDLSMLVPGPYPAQRCDSVNGDVAVESVTPGNIRRKIFRLRDGCAFPIGVTNQSLYAVRRRSNLVMIGAVGTDFYLRPLVLDTSVVSNTGPLVEVIPRFNVSGFECYGFSSLLHPPLEAEILDPGVPITSYEPKYGAHAVLPGTSFSLNTFLGTGASPRYYFPVSGPVSGLQVTWRGYYHDWR